MNTSDVQRRLEPSHLSLEDDVLKEDLERKIAPEENETVDPDDPKAQKEYTFKLNYTDGRGKVWNGEFTNKILSIKERQLVGALRSQYSGGLPVESLDALTVEMNLMLAHMAYSLTAKPKWADNLRDLEDVALVQAIYGEVASHEAIFFGW